MKIKVYSQDGKEKSEIELSDELFGGEINQNLLHLVLKSYASNKRQGTAKAKGRSEVSGGGKKPFRQKGTGRARAGSNTSPLYVRGGKAFGPQPRSYKTTIPQKMRKAALKGALTSRAQDNRIIVVDEIACEAPKTKVVAEILKSLPLKDRKNLIVTEEGKKNIYLSARNIKDTSVVPVSMLNALDILQNENIILSTVNLVKKIEEVVEK